MTAKKTEQVQITPPNFGQAVVAIRGTAPYVQARFSQKAKNAMKAKMEAGSQAKKGTKRDPRDFNSDYEGAFYRPSKGGYGLPASSFRSAMISACRLVGFKMTIAKMSVFVVADDFDKAEGFPLVALFGEPEKWEAMTRNATGVADIRIRPMWREWTCKLHLRWDMDQFSAQDVINLLARAGEQVGVGEGRPDSKSSNGLGFGTFEIVKTEEIKK